MQEPIAIVGYSLQLPQDIDNGEKFLQVIREKRQVSLDLVDNDIMKSYEWDELKEGNPWLRRCRRSNFFGLAEGK